MSTVVHGVRDAGHRKLRLVEELRASREIGGIRRPQDKVDSFHFATTDLNWTVDGAAVSSFLGAQGISTATKFGTAIRPVPVRG